MGKLTYKSSGVDIEAGNYFVKIIKPLVETTHDKNTKTGLGGFSGVYSPQLRGIKTPLLVASTDGVGTKLKIAIESKKLDTIGIDLVAMCVNDIVTCGAKPLFFLDYLSTSKLNPTESKQVIRGIVKGCNQAGCALLGGETAEMPGFYKKGDFDIAGFSVGIVDEKKFIDGKKVIAGDIVIGLGSSGLHSNGYSLARKVLFNKTKFRFEDKPKGLRKPIYKELLDPTRIYVRTILDLVKKFEIKSIAHITGSGLIENIPRVIPDKFSVVLDSKSWKLPTIIRIIKEKGNVDDMEMYRTFNCGIGMAIVISKRDCSKVISTLERSKEKAYVIGEIVKSKKGMSSVEVI